MRLAAAILGAALALFAMPAAAQVSATLPVTCNPNSAGDCIRSSPVTNPDGTTIGTPQPSASVASGVAPVANGAVSGSQIVKASPGNLYGLNLTSGASAGYVMLFNATTVPADGAVTPVKCLPIAANTGLDLNWRATPIAFSVGIVAVFSTTGCYSKTISATAFISADAK